MDGSVIGYLSDGSRMLLGQHIDTLEASELSVLGRELRGLGDRLQARANEMDLWRAGTERQMRETANESEVT